MDLSTALAISLDRATICLHLSHSSTAICRKNRTKGKKEAYVDLGVGPG
jgi:hypothetical protein